MQIIIPDITYDHPERDYDQFIKDIHLELEPLQAEVDLNETEIGLGADWPVILVVLSGLFFLGKPINDNLEAWLSLVTKFKTVLSRLMEKFGTVRLDIQSAELVALDEIANQEDGVIQSIKPLDKSSLPIYELPYHPENRLDRQPDSLYIFAYNVNSNKMVIVGIKSRGTLEFYHEYSTSHFDF